jgi:hypothetical protein
MVVHACSASYSRGRDRGAATWGQPRQKKKKMVARLYLTNKLIMVVHACRPSCSGGGDRKITA